MTTNKIFEYLEAMTKYKASDLYLTVGFPATLRIEDGDTLMAITDRALGNDEIEEIIDTILSGRQRAEFDKVMEMNTALDLGEKGRYRVNVLRQRQHSALVIRRIVTTIPDFTKLRLPQVLEGLALERRGMVLVTGMTGSGKSTTLAAMIDHRNQSDSGHIITIEDPIEYYHEHKKCVVTQREVGTDTASFKGAIKNALRQRPDVILIGEIRDEEVMEQAVIASETGHLCLATLHTNNSYQAIERIINLFSEDQQKRVKLNLAMNLKAIVSQRLLPCVHGGMVVAVEVLINQGLIRELIAKGEISKIEAVIAQNRSIGMCTFDQYIIDLYRDGMITIETAISYADKPAEMKVKLQQQALSNPDDPFGALDTSGMSLSDSEIS